MTLIRGYMAMSLDGYIADSNGGYGFLGRYDGVDYGFGSFFDEIGTCVFGRATWDQAAGVAGGLSFFKGKRFVVVTSRPLARGDILGPADVHAEERDITRMGYGYIASLEQITGHSLARPLIAGVVLEPGELNSRETVRAGDEVALIADIGGIEVRTSGMALDGGDTGAHLRVRNGDSGRIIDGVVVGAGEVKALP